MNPAPVFERGEFWADSLAQRRIYCLFIERRFFFSPLSFSKKESGLKRIKAPNAFQRPNRFSLLAPHQKNLTK
ncbi:hypothetical protein A2V95_03220 [Candidatus Kuenenbacteria bacterium RBG_16_41_7]|uniref:Uncharacterized protein n=1 Tax=Candidatus Kuenenbacteria bacterium RBG_16_41_7 TaxID=1798560 RepID=A0A1F6GC17_9BACT|nr:MAG: hypothetical protein A2V95_03220 [Candidatus Kuenenbacteria bacterium RBG_16_41_7]